MKKKRSVQTEIAPPIPQTGTSVGVWLYVMICVLLALIVIIPYGQALGHNFITQYDDTGYIIENSQVHTGFSMATIRWAFTTYREANWHPLTWISHSIDCQFWGLNPKGHHLTNIILHIFNTLLLFLVFSRMTKSVWRSAFVAALFAIHPVHVESVAWVAERKDVLSTFFWLLTMYSYAVYAKRPGVLRYLPVLLCYGLGLLAKPMLVSLPLVLLLVDYWPLNRVKFSGWGNNNLTSLLFEKIPLFAMVVGSSVITFIAQRAGGAVGTLQAWPVGMRLGNAVVSYVLYIYKMLWPAHLAVFYPHPREGITATAVFCASMLMIGLTILAIRSGRKHKYFITGWFWYLITMVPIIGLVQVGMQSMADRYTYITLTGIFAIIAWGVPDLLLPAREIKTSHIDNRKGQGIVCGSCILEPDRRVLAIPALIIIITLTSLTYKQVSYWKDSTTLFEHALKVTNDNYLAYGGLSTMYKDEAMKTDDEALYKKALDYSTKSVEIMPTYIPALNTLGILLDKYQRYEESVDVLNRALKVNPKQVEVYNNLGNSYADWGLATNDNSKRKVAIEYYNKALAMDPTYARAYNGLGALYGPLGMVDKAIYNLEQAVKYEPGYADAHGNLAIGYFIKGRYNEAWKEVHICEQHGGQPDMQVVEQLRQKARALSSASCLD